MYPFSKAKDPIDLWSTSPVYFQSMVFDKESFAQLTIYVTLVMVLCDFFLAIGTHLDCMSLDSSWSHSKTFLQSKCHICHEHFHIFQFRLGVWLILETRIQIQTQAKTHILGSACNNEMKVATTESVWFSKSMTVTHKTLYSFSVGGMFNVGWEEGGGHRWLGQRQIFSDVFSVCYSIKLRSGCAQK